MHNSRRRHQRHFNQLEALESRQLLSAALVLATHSTAHFVEGDDSATLIGTLPKLKYTIPEDNNPNVANLHAQIDWGDGSTSEGILHRTVNNRIEVWAGHAYADLKVHTITVLTDTGGTPKIAMKTAAATSLNGQRGKTLNAAAGQLFAGIVATLQRNASLPAASSAQSSLVLPSGTQFAQHAVQTVGETTSARIDWGDGNVSDGLFISHAGAYGVLGDHVYAGPGAYRVVVNLIVESADGTVLHIDAIDSTARVKAPRFHISSIPTHTQVDWTSVLPLGATLSIRSLGTVLDHAPPPGIASTFAGGFSAGGSVPTLALKADDGFGIPAGAASAYVSRSVADAGSISTQGGIIHFLANVSTSQTTALFNKSTLFITPLHKTLDNTIISSGMDLGSGLISAYDASGNFSAAFLSSPAGDILTERSANFHSTLISASGGYYRRTYLSLSDDSLLVGSLSTPDVNFTKDLFRAGNDNLAFNLNTPSNIVTTLMNLLPASYAGIVMLPPSALGLSLPSLPHATVLLGIPVPAGTILKLVDLSGNTTVSATIPV